MRLTQNGHSGEVEDGERLAKCQAAPRELALDAAAGAINEFEFGKCGEQERRWPALLANACAGIGPKASDVRQSGFAQDQR
jgi:hypothetical protein